MSEEEERALREAWLMWQTFENDWKPGEFIAFRAGWEEGRRAHEALIGRPPSGPLPLKEGNRSEKE